MGMRALDLKLLRELWRLKMQMLSITLVVATGIMSVLTMRGTYESLVVAQEDYYVKSRFADLWAPLVRAPESLVGKIELISGIETIDTRVSFLATLDLDGLGMPTQGRFVSIPELNKPLLNDILIQEGRYIVPGATDEVIISEKFALAQQLRPGNPVKVIINGRMRALDIVGIANSPEHSYAVPPGALFPEDERYGVFWVNRETLGPAFDMDGAFNELVVKLTPDANSAQVMKTIDELLEPYGGFGSYLREDQISHQMLENELAENKVMGTAIPAVFLSVAVFLLYLVLGRLIATQRSEIAVLKAFGYRDWELGRHFLMFAVVAVLLGAVLGIIGGVLLGTAMVEIYTQYFDIPDLVYHLSPSLLIVSVSVSILGACSGAMSAVQRAIKLPPAEAMRPEAPSRFKPGPIEKLGLGRLLSSSGRMILRNIERKPWQCFLSAIGVAMSLAILIIGMFMFDSISYMMNLQFRVIQREDISISFKEIVPEEVRFDLARLEGVTHVETYRLSAARLYAGHRKEEVAVQGLDPLGRLRRIINADGLELPVPSEGIVLSALLAKRLAVSRGDELRIEWLEGKRLSSVVEVNGVVEDFIGMSALMSTEALRKMTGDSQVISGAYLLVEDEHKEAIYAELKQIPAVAGVASPETMLASFEKEMANSLLIAAGFLLGFASIIAVGVIYNGARISLSERGRELASLRVMGFQRREVAVLLLGEQAIITLLAIPIGCWFGYALSKIIAASIETDSFRIPFIVNPQTYIVATVIILFSALLSSLAVRRRLDKFDLVEVLKTRE